MEASALGMISTDAALRNLEVALLSLYERLRHEGRYVAAEHVNVATSAVDYALNRHGIRTPGHE